MSVMSVIGTEPRQDDVLRLLETRMACLLVDRPGTESLRRHLFVLREKLANETIDRATLAQVEATVRELRPAGVKPASTQSEPQTLASRLVGEATSRALVGATGLSALTLLALQVAG
ncbi:hypothetical protein [Ferruginivarius sediminum]|uniref:Uncharacterized protein n=1 Tax=Ferruginivarius sediminum TaxID=2661937 RepID=A0A369T6L1_9PROT|nr:hypothetical protein [Ferruginivarius sediminum]RDD60908.1 hypothetical protein DRB17_15725 [Ferruginivarius sediminum]